MGRDSTTSPSRERNRSGDADATWQPTAGMRTTALYGAGLPSASAAPRAATSPPGGSGAESRRVRFTWYTSPAAIDARIERTPSMNSGSVSELVQASGSGPTHGGPGQGRAGRTLAKRAQIGVPSKGSTTAQKPCESSAARSSSDRRDPSPGARRRPRAGSGPGGPSPRRRRIGPSRQRTITPRPRRQAFHPSTTVPPPLEGRRTRARGVHRGARRAAKGRARVRRGRDRAARGGVGPRPPLPGRRRAGDGRSRAVRHPVPGGVRRGRWRPHDAVHRDRGAGARRPLDGDHPRGGGGPRSQPDPQVRHGGAEADVAARPVRRADASVASGSPSRRRAATRAAPARPPCSTTRRGSG